MKKIHLLTAFVLIITCTSCETLKIADLTNFSSVNKLSTAKIIAGLKEALTTGSNSAVKQLSQDGGFTKNRLYRIGIPEKLSGVTDTMKKVGLGFMVTEFEHKMNEAAEQATAVAGPVFVDAITQMNFTDAKEILSGNNNAATEYLWKTTYSKLFELYKPIVKAKMTKVGVAKVYNNLMSKYDAIPFKSKPKFSLEDYITNQSLDGMFDLLAVEEKKIRENPAARTTELLKEVFGK